MIIPRAVEVVIINFLSELIFYPGSELKIFQSKKYLLFLKYMISFTALDNY